MISGIGPERAPNGDFGGRSFQGVGGAPTSLRGAAVPFPGAPNTPGSDIGQPNIMRDTTGRRSNATIQYSRVVPMGSKAQKLETDALRAGVLAWTSNDEKMQKRSGRGVERMYKLTSWNWIQDEMRLLPRVQGPTSPTAPPRPPDDTGLRQKHAVHDGGAGEVSLWLPRAVEQRFALGGNRHNGSPYLMWLDWNENAPLRNVNELSADYEDLENVKLLWNGIYDVDTDTDEGDVIKTTLFGDGEVPPRLLSSDVMGAYKPDGFVLYKYSTEGLDSVAEGLLDDSQNGLFNIVVGGHALVTSWAVFDSPRSSEDSAPAPKKAKRLVTLPRDTLYIVVKGRWLPHDGGGGWFVDLRYVRSTSEELLRNSTTNRLGEDTNVDLKSEEVVLGAWRIGSVIDAAASRTKPSTFASAPTTPIQTMGLTVSVGIRWVTSYALHDMFHDVAADEAPPQEEIDQHVARERAARADNRSRVTRTASRPSGDSRSTWEEEMESGSVDGYRFSSTSSAAATDGAAGLRGTFRFGTSASK